MNIQEKVSQEDSVSRKKGAQALFFFFMRVKKYYNIFTISEAENIIIFLSTCFMLIMHKSIIIFLYVFFMRFLLTYILVGAIIILEREVRNMNIFDNIDAKVLETVWAVLWDKVDKDVATDAEQRMFWELGRYYDHKKRG